ncbi:MAG: D-arabinono-1,4-lactone oxidase [Chloroflexota bacterium]
MTQANHSPIQQNWATNIQFRASNCHVPKTVEQLQEIVQRSTKAKVLGATHCFNTIADTTGTQISLHQMDLGVTIDREKHTATVPASMTYMDLAPMLHQEGYALRNMASLPHITVIGACMSGTHGSGDGNGSLATHVSALEMVKADGELVRLSREKDAERFNGMVVALGSLGVVTQVTLELVPAYAMQQQVYRWLPLADVEAHFDEIMASGYSVSLFGPWRDKVINQVWVKQVVDGGKPLPIQPTLFGAKLADREFHPLDELPSAPCTKQLGVPGPWYDRLPHYHISSSMTGGDELQTEYFVSRKHAVEAILAIERLNERMAPFFKTSEVRSIAADQLWLSMAYQQDCIGFHFSWYNRWAEVSEFLPILEEMLMPFAARPHWGKLFTMSPQWIQDQYERLADFRALVDEFDPQRKFSNPFLDRYIWGH